jgi:hypothetical protein
LIIGLIKRRSGKNPDIEKHGLAALFRRQVRGLDRRRSGGGSHGNPGRFGDGRSLGGGRRPGRNLIDGGHRLGNGGRFGNIGNTIKDNGLGNDGGLGDGDRVGNGWGLGSRGWLRYGRRGRRFGCGRFVDRRGFFHGRRDPLLVRRGVYRKPKTGHNDQ